MKTHARALSLAALFISMASRTAVAAPVKTYSFAGSAFVEDPTNTWIYAAAPALNAVEVINASTLAIAHTVAIGSSPDVLALSADGSTLFVGGSGSTAINRLNTATLATLPSLTAPNGVPASLQLGTNNRLWVLSGNGIHQIDSTTGLSTGADAGTTSGMYPLLVNDGEIHVSADGKSLYYANSGYSPSNAYRYDVSGATAQETWAYTGGGNGRTLAVSNDGTKFAYASAGDDHGAIAVNNTSPLSQLGLLSQPATNLTFSANDRAIFGTFTYLDHVDQYDASTYQLLTPGITLAGDGQDLFSNNAGNLLFVGESSGTEVFAVVTPEPATAALLGAALALFAVRRAKPSIHRAK